jgi:hypothetical protein
MVVDAAPSPSICGNENSGAGAANPGTGIRESPANPAEGTAEEESVGAAGVLIGIF